MSNRRFIFGLLFCSLFFCAAIGAAEPTTDAALAEGCCATVPAGDVPSVSTSVCDCPTALNSSTRELPSDCLIPGECFPCEAATCAASQCTNQCDYSNAGGNLNGQQVKLKKPIRICDKTFDIAPGDEVWVISARGLECGSADPCSLTVEQLCHGSFQPSTLQNLTDDHEANPSLQTVIYIHGNQTDEKFARARGLQMYENGLGCSSECRGPIRFVIWMWKAERVLPRLYPDYMIKSQRSVGAGKMLGHTLAKFHDNDVVLIAFSLGAQLVTSAMEVPELQGDQIARRPRFRVAFVAAALDANYICRRLNGYSTTSCISRAIIATSEVDRATRAFHFVARKNCPQLKESIAELALAHHIPLGDSIEVIDVTGEVGKKHAIERYSKSPNLQQHLLQLLTP